MEKNQEVKNTELTEPNVAGISENFVGLPIEALICKPILAAAEGQRALTEVYNDAVKALAYSKEGGGSGGSKKTNKLEIDIERPIVSGTEWEEYKKETFRIQAPMLAQVPVPAFAMDELNVSFNMDVKSMSMDENNTCSKADSSISYKSWFGLNANIPGSVTSDSQSKHELDSTATYKIQARAIQHPQMEGMTKLNELLAQAMEPIRGQQS